IRRKAELDQARDRDRTIDRMDGGPGIDLGRQIGRKTDDVQLDLFRFGHGKPPRRKAIWFNIQGASPRFLRRIKRQQTCQFGMLINKAVLLSPRRCRYLQRKLQPLRFSMPDAIELLKTRRSMKPREMTGPGPSPAEIETILTIG